MLSKLLMEYIISSTSELVRIGLERGEQESLTITLQYTYCGAMVGNANRVESYFMGALNTQKRR